MNGKPVSLIALIVSLTALAGCPRNQQKATTAYSVPVIKRSAPTIHPVTAASAITITVPSGARQAFGGLGNSMGNWDGTYQTLQPQEREMLSRALWQDLRFKVLRLWMNTDEYAPTEGEHTLAKFRRCYIDSGLIADAKKYGVTTLQVTPDKLPAYMQDGNNIKDDQVENYALLIAEFIAQLRDEAGVTVQATGIQNEPNNHNNGPGEFNPDQMVRAIKSLRSELDSRDLSAVKIIGSETGSVDDKHYGYVAALMADGTAWDSLAAVSSHSYNMASTDKAGDYVAGTDGKNTKEYWMTEASDNGPEVPGDLMTAAGLAGRFLNDMNHRVTHWVHFLGFETDDPKDNATRIISYSANPFQAVVFEKYYVYQQLAQTFDVGALFRDSESSHEGDMAWTYGKKPHVIAATAKNPDGSWGIGVVNYTANAFPVRPGEKPEWVAAQGGYTPAMNFPVTIKIAELKGKAAVPFTLHRTNGSSHNAKAGTVMMKNGAVTIKVTPLELVTLRSSPAK